LSKAVPSEGARRECFRGDSVCVDDLHTTRLGCKICRGRSDMRSDVCRICTIRQNFTTALTTLCMGIIRTRVSMAANLHKHVVCRCCTQSRFKDQIGSTVTKNTTSLTNLSTAILQHLRTLDYLSADLVLETCHEEASYTSQQQVGSQPAEVCHVANRTIPIDGQT
jgi:hypothetical protein